MMFSCVYSATVIMRLMIKVKWYSSPEKNHLRATGFHLPYGITQCYLPPNTSEHTPQ